MVKKGHDRFVYVEAAQFPYTEKVLVPLFTHSFGVTFKGWF